ncbi:hypothetical protein [Candidatus Ichthyocystis hellenicum]|uniref:hypothetical protein n=1 Tax=Candidatus Ichthyocystis hellenicum TaxID=1561003 RepID=UPI001F5E758F|nr:hypothetical protein [Candidatus Ichthyocystis hellenicum]
MGHAFTTRVGGFSPSFCFFSWRVFAMPRFLMTDLACSPDVQQLRPDILWG